MSDQDIGDVEALAVRWAAVIGGAPPSRLSPERIIRSLHYAEQVAADPVLTRLDRDVNRRLRQLAKQSSANQRSTSAALLPGTRLLREWGEQTHEVTVIDQGFVYRGTRYRSLSAIAHAITGARWSGPKFFRVT